MNEASINTEIVKSICAIPQSWAWKIPDSSSRGRDKQAFIPARAFDIIACVHGLAYAIETKHINGLGGLSVDKITEFELRSLRGFSRAEGSALLAISWAANATALQQKKHGLSVRRVRQLVLLPIENWDELTDAFVREGGSKTIPRAAIMERSLQAKWAGHGMWEIEPALYGLQPMVMPGAWKVGKRDEMWVPFDGSKNGRIVDGLPQKDASCDDTDG